MNSWPPLFAEHWKIRLFHLDWLDNRKKTNLNYNIKRRTKYKEELENENADTEQTT